MTNMKLSYSVAVRTAHGKSPIVSLNCGEGEEGYLLAVDAYVEWKGNLELGAVYKLPKVQLVQTCYVSGETLVIREALLKEQILAIDIKKAPLAIYNYLKGVQA